MPAQEDGPLSLEPGALQVLRAAHLREHLALGGARQLGEPGVLRHHPPELAVVVAQHLAAPVFRPGGEGARQVVLGGAPSHTDRHHEIADSRPYPQGPLP